MAEGIDNRVRELVKSSSIETREAIFEDMLRELMQVEPEENRIPLVAADGELVGYFVRPEEEIFGPPPNRTPEQEVEYQRRLATIDHVIDADELLRRLTQRSKVATP
jgi:hypothetical protein